MNLQCLSNCAHCARHLPEREGVPAYALFTNEQLAAMVRSRVGTATGLGAIEGVGKSRIEKYGAAFLELLSAETSKLSDTTQREGDHAQTQPS